MAAHRYWRAVSIEAYGLAGLEISEFHLLYAGSRVDAAATLTSSSAPSAGSLAGLKDDNTATGAAWPAAALPVLAIAWDFGGSPQDVNDIRIGAADDPKKFPLTAKIQWSDDAVTWTEFTTFSSIMWPGARVKTVSVDRTIDPYTFTTTAQLLFNGANASTTIVDEKGSGWLAAGAAQLSTAQAKYGSASLRLPGTTGSYVHRPYVPALFDWWTEGAYTLDVFCYPLAYPAAANLIGNMSPSGATNYWSFGLNNAGQITFGYRNNSVFTTITGTTVAPLNAFSMLRLAVSGTTIMLFLNGNLEATATVAGTPASSSGEALMIGQANSIPLDAYVDFVRVTRQVARSTATFTPPDTVWAEGNYIAVVRGAGRVLGPVVWPSAVSIPMAFSTKTSAPIKGRRDYLNPPLGQGIGRVKGTTKDKGSPNVPVSERVRLYREVDGLLIRETRSTPGTGEYSFDYVDELQAYTVISYDAQKTFRAVVADNLTLAGGGVELIA